MKGSHEMFNCIYAYTITIFDPSTQLMRNSVVNSCRYNVIAVYYVGSMEDYAMMSRGRVNGRFDIPAGMHTDTTYLHGTGQSVLKLNFPI